jgi:arylsulfatase A-like enzyme
MKHGKDVSRQEFLKMAGAASAAATLGGCVAPAELPKALVSDESRPLNLLFIMTDQQRFDALSRAGNSILQTPNLDRLAREGVFFENAYTVCPVCGPARSCILTGHDIVATGVPTNSEAEATDNMYLPSFDNLLADQGYWTGYVGKWHSTKNPDRLAYDLFSDLGKQVQTLRKSIGEPRPLKAGEQYDGTFRQPYKMDPIDKRYDWAPDEKRLDKNGKPVRVIQPDNHGCLDIPVDQSLTALQAKETIAALEQMGDQPFSLTCSLHFPHSPILPTEPYYSMYPPEDMPLPESIDDPMTNSPYEWNWGRGDERYRSDDIRYMISNYYGLVKEIDDWVGKILDTLRDKGFEENTLVIFTSDHGEMLGAHGMREKNIFYDESAHIPLIMRLPGGMPLDRVVETPVSQIDLFATILDYLGQPVPANHGRSLRPLIDKRDDHDCFDFAVQEWPHYPGEGKHFVHFGPNFMVRTEEWKFMFASTPESTALDALYNMKDDPLEMNNLLGSNPRAPEFIGKDGVATKMKDRLVAWLEHIDSPHLQGVKNRPLQALPNKPNKE